MDRCYSLAQGSARSSSGWGASFSWMVRRRLFAFLALPAVVLAAALPQAEADPIGTILHEQIPPDPREDQRLAPSLDGELPVAIDTTSGPVNAPDPRRPIPPRDPAKPPESDTSVFKADNNTRRPDVQGYEEPFDPSTAPFKRLNAFDSVRPNYELYVANQSVQLVMPGATPNPETEDQFFADMIVDVAPGKRARIPSVGAGTKIVRARLGVGPEDMRFRILRDGAENWFIEGIGAPARARLVMELTVPRAVFGGEFADVGWSELRRPPGAAAGEREAGRARGAGGPRNHAGHAAARGGEQARRSTSGASSTARSRRAVEGDSISTSRSPRRASAGTAPSPSSSRRREHEHPDAHAAQRGSRVGRGPRRHELAAHRPRRRGAHGEPGIERDARAAGASGAGRRLPVAAGLGARRRHGRAGSRPGARAAAAEQWDGSRRCRWERRRRGATGAGRERVRPRTAPRRRTLKGRSRSRSRAARQGARQGRTTTPTSASLRSSASAPSRPTRTAECRSP